MSKVIIFSAPSGSGKSTLINYLFEVGYPLEFSISATSRAPRGQEQDGREYYFLSAEEFRRRIENDEFVEYEEVYAGCFYGTLRSEITRIAGSGKYAIFDVDVKGGKNLKRVFGDEALSVFIMPPSVEELRRRLVSRATDAPEKIEQRVARAAEEIAQSGAFDRIVVNSELERAKADIRTVIDAFLNE